MNQKLEQFKKEDSLDTVQQYIKKLITTRGFSKQPVEQEMLLLIEEIGEFAKSINTRNCFNVKEEMLNE